MPLEEKDGDTNKHLNKIFHEHLKARRKIILNIADLEPFEINGVRVGKDPIGDRFKRCALESILFALAQRPSDFESLHIVVDPVEKARHSLPSSRRM